MLQFSWCSLRFVLTTFFLAATVMPLHAAQSEQAIPTDKAAKSLLLDVARAGNRIVAVGERGHIVHSDDEGKTWRQAKVPTRALLTAVHFPETATGFAVGHDSTILVSRDQGETWTIQHSSLFANSPPEPSATREPDEEPYPEEDWDSGDAPEEREIMSREGVPLLDVWFGSAQSGIAVGAYGLLMQTADGGKTWVDRSEAIPNPDGWHLNAVAGVPGSGNILFLAGERGTAYRSIDSGKNFIAIETPSDGSFFGLISTRNALYAFGLQGKVYRSSDLGESWNELDSNVTSGLNDACVSREGIVAITGNAGVILTAATDEAPLNGIARVDRQSVLSCVPIAGGLLLVGEGGAKTADASGKSR